MNRKSRLILLACGAVLLGFFLFRQSFELYHEARQFHRPNQETRQIGEMRVHSWMTPKEVADRYHVPVEQVFKALKIKPAPGDEQLPLRTLKDKYHLSKEELEQGLLQLIHSSSGEGVDPHE